MGTAIAEVIAHSSLRLCPKCGEYTDQKVILKGNGHLEYICEPCEKRESQMYSAFDDD